VERLALYREWRPQLFRDVIGQEHVCRTLRNAVRLGRVAHAYLFCGPRGTGKTSTARILAKAVNCSHSEGGEPCNRCPSCQNITTGVSLDVIEMDAASHRGIEEIRDLNQKVCFAPSGGKSRLFIIDEVHMLTGEAFNALLKTLEEPPRNIIFVLATTEAHKVPLTIVSRCQRFDFRRLGQEAIREHLRRVAGAEGWQIDDEALDFLGRHARGALRDALGLLEQAASFTGGMISRAELEALTGALSPDRLQELLAAVLAGDVPALLRQMDELFARGCEPRQVLFQLVDLVRQRLSAASGPDPEPAAYAALLRCLAVAEAELKGNSRPDLVLELSLLRFTDMLHPRVQAATPQAEQAATPQVQAATPDVRVEQAEQAVIPQAIAPQVRAEQVATPQAQAEQAVTPQAIAPQAQAVQAATPQKQAEQAATPQAEQAATSQVTAPQAQAATSQVTAPQVRAEQAEALKPAAQQKRPSGGIDLRELKRSLMGVFQKQFFVAQALASCILEQDGHRIIMKASTGLHQEMLLKEENRRKLQDAFRQRCPSLELEIVMEAGSRKPEAGKGRKQNLEEKKESVPKESDVRSRAPTSAVASEVGKEKAGRVDPVGVAVTLFSGEIIDGRSETVDKTGETNDKTGNIVDETGDTNDETDEMEVH
jgi:DNA polymerase-3 subunit gamma/tau